VGVVAWRWRKPRFGGHELLHWPGAPAALCGRRGRTRPFTKQHAKMHKREAGGFEFWTLLQQGLGVFAMHVVTNRGQWQRPSYLKGTVQPPQLQYTILHATRPWRAARWLARRRAMHHWGSRQLIAIAREKKEHKPEQSIPLYMWDVSRMV
jgi:hypothetical protein